MFLRKIAAALALSATLALGGCTPEQVQEITKQLCGYVPAISAINTIATAINPAVGLVGLGVAQTVAQTVCDAVNKSKATKGLRSPKSITAVVNGTPVKLNGTFVK